MKKIITTRLLMLFYLLIGLLLIYLTSDHFNKFSTATSTAIIFILITLVASYWLYNQLSLAQIKLTEQAEQHAKTTSQLEFARQRAAIRLKALVDNVSWSIITIDASGLINHINPATMAMFSMDESQLLGRQITTLLPTLNIHGGLFAQMLNAGVDIELDAVVVTAKISRVKSIELSCVELKFQQDESVQYILILHDISQRKKSEDRLRKLNQRLINTSRQAGMADIATSILHSVGNVLNSVNTSVAMLQQGLEKCRIDGLNKSIELLQNQGPTLFEPEGNGPQLIHYLDALVQQLDQQKSVNLAEVALLKQNINHIAEIVSAQQKFSGRSGVIERFNVVNVIEEALSINQVTLENYKVEVIRQYEPLIEIMGDRSKVIQILVNLIRNASEAMMSGLRGPAKITIIAEIQEHTLSITVADTGQGILPENINNMFRYGFTTKPGGHGFGLHSCALAAKEMQGSLTVRSEGEGLGASFELTLPIDPASLEQQQILSLSAPANPEPIAKRPIKEVKND